MNEQDSELERISETIAELDGVDEVEVDGGAIFAAFEAHRGIRWNVKEALDGTAYEIDREPTKNNRTICRIVEA